MSGPDRRGSGVGGDRRCAERPDHTRHTWRVGHVGYGAGRQRQAGSRSAAAVRGAEGGCQAGWNIRVDRRRDRGSWRRLPRRRRRHHSRRRLGARVQRLRRQRGGADGRTLRRRQTARRDAGTDPGGGQQRALPGSRGPVRRRGGAGRGHRCEHAVWRGGQVPERRSRDFAFPARPEGARVPCRACDRRPGCRRPGRQRRLWQAPDPVADVLRGPRGGADPGTTADDHNRHPVARRGADGAQEGDRQAPVGDPRPWRDDGPVHGQDGHAHLRPD